MSAATSKALVVAAELCRLFEGFSSKPYICPAGYATIGYGTVYKPDGSQVTMQHKPISRELAESWLLHELEHNYMSGVLAASPTLVESPLVLAAMTDFAYNLGVARYRASTLRRCVDAKNWVGARVELLRWTRGAGKVLPGLVKRREAEARLLPQ
ncbi:MAG: lysozyme [Bacteroidota bacterium]